MGSSRKTRLTGPGTPARLSREIYRAIAEWHHAALLELTEVEGFQADPQWIARELGIRVPLAQAAINRLLALGLLKREGETLRKAHDRLTSADRTLARQAFQNTQKQLLRRAIESIDNEPLKDRSMTTQTLAIAPELLPQAHEMIQEFNRLLRQFLGSGRRARVYHLGIALHPLQGAKRHRKRRKSPTTSSTPSK